MSTAAANPAVAFVAPLVLFLLIGSFEPRFSHDDRFSRSEPATTNEIDTPARASLSSSAIAKSRLYLWFNVAKLIAVGGCLVYFWPVYRELLPVRFSWLAVVVGAVGCVIWIGICQAGIEQRIATAAGVGETVAASRSHFNPFVAFAEPGWLTGFLSVRLAILVVLVPIAEELFLRGFLMRYLQSPDWTRQPFNRFTFWPLALGTLYGVITHPAEIIAAAVWFSLVTWMMVRSNSFWNCVLAHSLTNALLGLYVLTYGQWQLW